jgi:hypothetical protein
VPCDDHALNLTRSLTDGVVSVKWWKSVQRVITRRPDYAAAVTVSIS